MNAQIQIINGFYLALKYIHYEMCTYLGYSSTVIPQLIFSIFFPKKYTT